MLTNLLYSIIMSINFSDVIIESNKNNNSSKKSKLTFKSTLVSYSWWLNLKTRKYIILLARLDFHWLRYNITQTLHCNLNHVEENRYLNQARTGSKISGEVINWGHLRGCNSYIIAGHDCRIAGDYSVTEVWTAESQMNSWFNDEFWVPILY